MSLIVADDGSPWVEFICSSYLYRRASTFLENRDDQTRPLSFCIGVNFIHTLSVQVKFSSVWMWGFWSWDGCISWLQELHLFVTNFLTWYCEEIGFGLKFIDWLALFFVSVVATTFRTGFPKHISSLSLFCLSMTWHPQRRHLLSFYTHC